MKKMSQKEFKRKYKPWISDEIIRKIKHKNKIFKKYVNCKNTIRKQELNIEYKILKNKLTELTRQNKKIYYENYFSYNKKNLKKSGRGSKKLSTLNPKTLTNLLVFLVETNR